MQLTNQRIHACSRCLAGVLASSVTSNEHHFLARRALCADCKLILNGVMT